MWTFGLDDCLTVIENLRTQTWALGILNKVYWIYCLSKTNFVLFMVKGLQEPPTDKQPHTLIHTLGTISESSISLWRMILDSGKKPEFPEKTLAVSCVRCTVRKCTLHTKSTQKGFQSGPSHCKSINHYPLCSPKAFFPPDLKKKEKKYHFLAGFMSAETRNPPKCVSTCWYKML